MPLILSGDTGVPVTTVTGTLPVANGGTGSATNATGFKNRIINGAMVIDQRNAGASVTPSDTAYTLDRWNAGLTQASKFSVQQSSTAPTGFSSSLLVTSLSAYSVVSGDLFRIGQYIEGFNFADLGWGTASAQSITLSFQVRSSLTGTFSGAIANSAFNRSYPFTYTIGAANTWETKTVTIAGDTTGTWIGSTNGIGARVNFSLGAGSTYSGTAGAWAASTLIAATGATSVVGTNGATFYLTGVQLEVGSTATSFEYRPYGTELMLCQRYYEAIGGSFGGNAYSTTYFMGAAGFRVSKRAAPTLAFITTTPTIYQAGLGNVTAGTAINAASTANVDGFYMAVGGFAGLTAQDGCGMVTASVFSASSEL